MLKVVFNSKCSGQLEHKVRQKINMIAIMWDYIDDFERVFPIAMNEVIPLNHISQVFSFRLKQPHPLERVVWHYNLDGVMDRKVATITEVNK